MIVDKLFDVQPFQYVCFLISGLEPPGSDCKGDSLQQLVTEVVRLPLLNIVYSCRLRLVVCTVVYYDCLLKPVLKCRLITVYYINLTIVYYDSRYAR